MNTFLVSGCGISAVCMSQESVVFWAKAIVSHGGVPTVTYWVR